MKKTHFFMVLMLIFFVSTISAQGETFQFPLQGTDTFNVSNYPYWWVNGDYAQGQRTVLGQIGSGTLTLVFTNGLTTSCSPNYVDLNFSVNGQVVATHRINEGDPSPAIIPFTLPSPVNGTLNLRLEETNLVCNGGGAIQIADTGSSTLQLSATASATVPTMTEWGMIIFAAVAGLASIYYMRKQNRKTS